MRLSLCIVILLFNYKLAVAQDSTKIRFIDSLVASIDARSDTKSSITEGTVRPQYKPIYKNIFKKRRKGFFADWFVTDNKNHLLKVFNEMAVSNTHNYTTYYFCNDSLVFVRTKNDPGSNLSQIPLKEGFYYFENGLLLYATGQHSNYQYFLRNARVYLKENPYKDNLPLSL